MTIQAFVFLNQIRKVQGSELGTVCIDVDGKVMKTFIDEDVNPASEQKIVSLAKRWKSVDNITDYLQEENLLERVRTGHFYLNHKGYHYIQDVVLNFLFKSIAVPIVVALVTTLATLWIQGLFPPK